MPTTTSRTPSRSSGRWPIAWPSSLTIGQVDEDRAPEQAEEQPDAAEQVERPVAVAAHERHREEVEEAAHVPLDAVVRAAVLARPVVDGQLGDAVAAVVGEHGDVAVELAVELHALDDLGAVGLEPAVHVVQPHARDLARRPR